MERYMEPEMEVVKFDDAVIVTSCPDDDYPCDTELPPICIFGDD